ncbi:DUF424 family protein [Candidatus Pacearchaeota archaeon]|nr:DUF424 family protein [Candidatus Pacearchaeota archaeon]
MFVNIIKAYRDVVAICDSELLGKKFEEGKFQLDIKENFYRGKEANEAEILEIIDNFSKKDATFNLVGPKSVALGLKAGIILSEEIGEIKGTPFAFALF